jgi:hypothetical protein
MAEVLRLLWQRFWRLGWIGRLFAIAAVIYLAGWTVGTIGLNGLARELGTTALYIAAFPLTALALRALWARSTAHHRR